MEVGKAIALAFVSLIALIALQQLAATRSTQTIGDTDRAQVESVARDFGQNLTTYDYAHLDVQVNHLSGLVTSQVLDQVRQAFPDLAAYRAVSVGGTPDVYLQSVGNDQAQALVETHSQVQSQYAPSGTQTTGLLICTLRRINGSWRVSDYRWLTPVASGVS
jgi:hypothetical protein